MQGVGQGRHRGGTVRFVFYKASLGNYVTIDQRMKEQRLGTQVPRGREGRVDRVGESLEWTVLW